MSFMLAKASQIARSPGDPQILETGPSSRGTSDNAIRALGWFSLGLGLAELLASKRFTRALGLEGSQNFVRAMGAREIASGVTSLSVDSQAGAWSRVAGDLIDLASLGLALRAGGSNKRNVMIGIGIVAGVAVADLLTAQALTSRHSRGREPKRDFSDRSGFPQGVANARGAAADAPREDVRAEPAAALASQVTGETSPATKHLEERLQRAD